MAYFQSFNDWFDFIKYTKETNRFFLTARWHTFIEDVVATAQKRITFLTSNAGLFRARDEAIEKLIEKGDIIYPEYFPLELNDMKAPLPKKAKEGRFNPTGVSYLYLASDPETAIAECRPYKSSTLTVARFELFRSPKLIDTRKDSENIAELVKSGPYSSDETREKLVWGSIDWSFSRPILPREASVNYVATQRIAEVFKNNDFDGVLYRSSLANSGYNVVLFDPEIAAPKSRELYKVENIEYKSRKVDVLPTPEKIRFIEKAAT